MMKSARPSASWQRGEVRRATSVSVRDGAHDEKGRAGDEPSVPENARVQRDPGQQRHAQSTSVVWPIVCQRRSTQ
jgi:hypothetical protein